jgi:hypothetical protein
MQLKRVSRCALSAKNATKCNVKSPFWKTALRALSETGGAPWPRVHGLHPKLAMAFAMALALGVYENKEDSMLGSCRRLTDSVCLP